jgi:hypothetical protein
MANPKHMKIIKKGVPAWNKWRKKNEGIEPDFFRADLRETDLRRADLRLGDPSDRNKPDRSGF